MRKRSWDGVHRVGIDLIVLCAIVLPAGRNFARRPTFMILSMVLFKTVRPGRNFPQPKHQLSDQREFHSLKHCVIPVVRQFLFLNLVSSNVI